MTINLSTLAIRTTLVRSAIAICILTLVAACQTKGSTPIASTASAACTAQLSKRLDLAIEESRARMDGGCSSQHVALFDQLLTVGKGDPKQENKRMFSDYLVWASEKGYISPLQAKETYTRYFGLKFVSGLSDFNTCASFCPNKPQLIADMQKELGDKALGLIEVSSDQATYGRANTLFNELELVMTAACQACKNQ